MGAYQQRERLFLHQRARIVLDCTARDKAFQRCCLRRNKNKASVVFTEMIPGSVGEGWDYVWYCRRDRDSAKIGIPDHDDDLDELVSNTRLLENINMLNQKIDSIQEQFLDEEDDEEIESGLGAERTL